MKKYLEKRKAIFETLFQIRKRNPSLGIKCLIILIREIIRVSKSFILNKRENSWIEDFVKYELIKLGETVTSHCYQ